MTTLCLSSASLQAASHYSNFFSRAASKQLSSYTRASIRQPRSQAVKSQGCYPQRPALPAQKPLEPMLRANRPTRSLPLWLLPLLLIACTAGESIGFPHMVSNLPKRSCSAKHSSTLLQLTIHHTALICDVEDRLTFQLRHDEHHIVFMCSARWLEAYIYALSSDITQLVAPNMPSPFGKPAPGANENCVWTLRRHNQACDRNRLRHGLTKKSKPQSLTARVEPIRTAALMLLKVTHFVTISHNISPHTIPSLHCRNSTTPTCPQ